MSTMKILFAALVLTATLVSAPAATIASIKSGKWSDPTTWTGGVLPGTNDTAQIGAGTTVTNDMATLTVFQIRSRGGGTLIMDGSAATGDSMSHTIKFSDTVSAGFLYGGVGTFVIRGDAAYTQYVTTAASGAPANYWALTTGTDVGGINLDFDYTMFSYFQYPQGGNAPSIYIDNCTFSHALNSCFHYLAAPLKSFNNNVLEYNNDLGATGQPEDNACFWAGYGGPSVAFTNVTIRNTSANAYQVFVYGHDYVNAKWEFLDSNFDISMTSTGTYLRTYNHSYTPCVLVSKNHNDVQGNYRLIAGNNLSETNLILKFDKQDLTFTATVAPYPGYPYYASTMTVDRAVTVNSLNMDSKCYLDLSAGKNIYYYNTASYTPGNIIGPGQVLKLPTGTIVSVR